MIRKFALVALVFCVGALSQHPSTAEFNLFCRIWTEANDMMLEPDYVYDEDKDQEIVKEMQVLFNATTDNMEDFRKILWVTKDFFQEHPPPTHSESRKRAHREIGNLIDKGEKKIQDSRNLAKEVNKKIEEAKLSAVQGMYGEEVAEVPRGEGNWTAVKENTTSIFVSNTSAADSCGNGGDKKAGKTLINDFFCVCVGDGVQNKNPQSPCHGDIVPPKNGNGRNNGNWTQLKYQSGNNPVRFLAESIKTIEEICKDTLDENLRKNILGLLKEYVGLIEKGPKEANKKIFGHSGRKDSTKVTQCTGAGKQSGGTKHDKEENNADFCVDYSKHLKDGETFDIPWHTKFKNYTNFMKQAKSLEDQILKNRADLLLLKSQAWVAYSREKVDETSNLDDMNVSNLFDGARLPPSFPSLTYLFPFLFMIL